mmetsp:Transcript_22549/g.46847  ORF Transcript_22549/g.46847 Transcript_22549/m.46847 type:complete len:563 (-) Transcript_22549:76-1764(-)
MCIEEGRERMTSTYRMHSTVNIDTGHAIEISRHALLSSQPHPVHHPIFGVPIIIRTRQLQHQTSPPHLLLLPFLQNLLQHPPIPPMLQPRAMHPFQEHVESLLPDLHDQRARHLPEHERHRRKGDVDGIPPHGVLFVVDDQLSSLLELAGVEMEEDAVVGSMEGVGEGEIEGEAGGGGGSVEFDGEGVVSGEGGSGGVAKVVGVGTAEEGVVEIGQFQFETAICKIGGVGGGFPRFGRLVREGVEDGSVEGGGGHAEFFGEVVDGGGGAGEVGDEAAGLAGGSGAVVAVVCGMVDAFLFDGGSRNDVAPVLPSVLLFFFFFGGRGGCTIALVAVAIPHLVAALPFARRACIPQKLQAQLLLLPLGFFLLLLFSKLRFSRGRDVASQLRQFFLRLTADLFGRLVLVFAFGRRGGIVGGMIGLLLFLRRRLGRCGGGRTRHPVIVVVEITSSLGSRSGSRRSVVIAVTAIHSLPLLPLPDLGAIPLVRLLQPPLGLLGPDPRGFPFVRSDGGVRVEERPFLRGQRGEFGGVAVALVGEDAGVGVVVGGGAGDGRWASGWVRCGG